MLKNKKIKLAFIVLLSLLLLGGCMYFVYIRFFHNETQQTTGQDINYSEPTKTEQSETDENKERVIAETEAENNQNQPNSTQQTGKKIVKPVISYLGQDSPGSEIQANGYVPGIIEKDGRCTITFTRNSTYVRDTRTSIDNVQDTSCGLFIIPKAKLTNGTWYVAISYTSSKSSGTSEKATIEVK
jgi:hypothetical protein